MPSSQPVRIRSWARRATLIASLIVAVPASAHAQEAIVENAVNEDVVRLTDGTSLRGHVILTHPGCDLTLLSDAGASQIVPWAHIAAMNGPGFSAGARTPSGPHHDDETDFLVPGPGRVPMDVTSTGTEMVLGLATGFTSRGEICLTPCRLYVRPRLLTLTASGPRVRETATRIEVPDAGLYVRLRAPSAALSAAGMALVIVGGIASTAGTIFTAFGGATAEPTPEIIGGLGLGVGAALVLAGSIVLGRTQRGGIESMHNATAGASRNTQSHWRFAAAPSAGGLTVGVNATF